MKNSPYFKIIIFLIIGLCIGFLIPNTPYFKNKKLKELEYLNDSLYKEIDARNKNILLLDSRFNKLKNEKLVLEEEVAKRNNYINSLEHKIDSINTLILTSDTILVKIKHDGYEEINNVSNWNTNQRINFFTDYFKTTNP